MMYEHTNEGIKMSADVMNLERKVVKFGNSLGSTFPKKVLNHLNVHQGDQIIYRLNDDGTVTIEKQTKVNLPHHIDLDFINTVSEVIDEYDEAIKKLAKR